MDCYRKKLSSAKNTDRLALIVKIRAITARFFHFSPQ